MITYTAQHQIDHQLFKTPFQQQLREDNRWVRLASILPWDKMAIVFMSGLNSNKGRSSIDLRAVMGAMFIQYTLKLTDRETLQIISENIYMQYFVGLSTFQTEPIFDHSLMTTLRKRLGAQGSSELNEIFLEHALDTGLVKHRKARQTHEDKKDNSGDGLMVSGSGQQPMDKAQNPETELNKGRIKVDATVAPQDISYPTDTGLLNHARELSEQIIDLLYEQCRHLVEVKPRTYRREARKKWLTFTKKRRPSKALIMKQKKIQLGYLKRNLRYIDELLALGIRSDVEWKLPEHLRKKMYVISELYRQQKIMYDDRRKKINDRIVNIAQPWVRPIVRGKAGTPVEFGAKLNLSLTQGYLTVDQASYDAFHEGKGLIDILETYKKRFGYFPQYALVDKIYLTKENRKFMKNNNIQHTGPPLGRPKSLDKNQKRKHKKIAGQRNHIEGKIGQAKRKYGMDLIKTKLASTSLCAIHLIALTINMVSLMEKAYYSILSPSIAYMSSSYFMIIPQLTMKYKPYTQTPNSVNKN